MPEQKKATFNLCNAVINQFAIFEENNASNKEDINVNANFHIKYDEESNVVSNECSVTFLNGDKPILKAVVTLDYKLTSETVETLIKNDTLTLPKDLLMYFASNTYGATRGVIMSKLEGSPVQLLLPLMELNPENIPPFKMKLAR